jgi:uncharacterized membrane protein YfcA
MNWAIALVAGLALVWVALIGLSLGLLGSGGSILTLPMLHFTGYNRGSKASPASR